MSAAIPPEIPSARTLREDNERLSREIQALKGGGGSGTYDGMESRVSILETHMGHVRDSLKKLDGLPAEVAVLTTKVEALPSKEWIDIRLLGMLAIIAALVAFGDKIRALLN